MTENKNKIPKQGEVYKITAEGSLGLLAIGYKGVIAWRKVRNETVNPEQLKGQNPSNTNQIEKK